MKDNLPASENGRQEDHGHEHAHKYFAGHMPHKEHAHGGRHVCQRHGARHHHNAKRAHRDGGGRIITIRSHSGLSGDMLLAGLGVLNMRLQDIEPEAEAGCKWFSDLLELIMPGLGGKARVKSVMVNHIQGWRLIADLPHEHEHRNLDDIKRMIAASGISEQAKAASAQCFELLATCEAAVHGKSVSDVHFHEVGALDSIMDICAACELMARLEPCRLLCGPLPLADGRIHCAHGVLPAPAPAVLRLLRGVPVRPFDGDDAAGELVTPTAIALLLALNAEFGPWPAFIMEQNAIAYGRKEFADAPNGAVFAVGR